MPASLALVWFWTVATTPAPADPYRVTPSEKAACTQDATRLCANTYPDETRLLACMQAHRASLSPACQVALDAGIKRRGL